MRWEALFTDLEAELAAAQDADLELEIRDRTRREVAALRLTDRVRPAVGHEITVYADGAPPLAGGAGAVSGKLDLRHALRGLARGRLPVAAVLRDATTLHGTLDRVGADFVEVALHAPGEARRQPAVSAVRTVPLTALSVVRSG
jgi:hypothetical protein